MDQNKHKIQKRKIRHNRVRSKVSGTADKPRLSVYRSLGSIYGQLINDDLGVTLAQVSGSEVKTKGKKTELAREAGKKLAEKALAKNIQICVFDRGGYLYHGRIKAFAEGAREGGLKF